MMSSRFKLIPIVAMMGTVVLGCVWLYAQPQVGGQLSVPVQVTVDPLPLPADPGEAGKQTLEGIDSDGDGVRDDVQRWIALSEPRAPATRAALRQLAAAEQLFILNADSDITFILAIVERSARAQSCLGYIAGDERGLSLSKGLTAQLLNTEARSLAYVTAIAQLSTLSSPVIMSRSSTCDFDPVQLLK